MGTNQRHYRIVGLLGVGGFGKVYHAVFEGPYSWRKEVAIKRLLAIPDPDANEEFERRLRDEARILSMLKHRNIVVVDLLTRMDGDWCVVMELLPGLDLGYLLHHGGPLPEAAALEAVAETASALAYAWEAPTPEGTALRLIHRDLKPQNLMLCEDGGLKVLDFGIARAEYAGREALTNLYALGTPLYMPPERQLGTEHERGDCYSLIAVLYALLAGDALGAAHLDPDAQRAMVEAGIRRLGTARALGAGVVDLLRNGLARSPDARPSAAEIEVRCRALARDAEGEDLVSLGRRVIPPLRAMRRRRAPPSDPEIGRVLVEQIEDAIPVSGPVGPNAPDATATDSLASVPPSPPSEPPILAPPTPSERRRLHHMGIALGFMMVLGAALVAAGLASASGLLRPKDNLVKQGAGNATPLQDVASKSPGPPLQVAGPTMPIAAHPPSPAQPQRVSVTATPKGLAVELRGPQGTVVLPGKLAPGNYDAFATFRDAPEYAGFVVINPMVDVVLDCTPGLRSCRLSAP